MKVNNNLFNAVLTMCIFLFSGNFLFGQMATLEGTVSDADGPLIGATVIVSGSTKGTSTGLDGNYYLTLREGTHTINVSFVGFSTASQQITVSSGEKATLDFLLSAGTVFDEVVVLGTRATNRTNTDSPVPVDVINVATMAISAPQTSVNQILHYTAPSFSSNTQTISDGTDHIDPASLRGLGPDQVLVLMNGKRRHTTSLVNVNGTFGRGNVGTDMNAIPAFAINNIQVLRDGAAAQYGSDAIAGVIDLNLKKSVNELGFSITTGGNFTSEIGPFEGKDKSVDGEVVNLGVNYGLPLGSDGGFINVTGEFDYRGASNRMQNFTGQIFSGYNAVERVASTAGADISQLSITDIQSFAQSVGHFDGSLKANIAAAADISELQALLNFDATTEELAARGQVTSDYNMRVGQSELRGGKLFVNMAIPLGNDLEFYSFGGSSYRRGISGCFYRLPFQSRTSTSVYINGTVPRINSNIHDKSIAAGIRGNIGDWHIDFSNVWGSNSFNFFMTQTHNATLGSSTPTTFNSGGHDFTQNTANFDISQYFENVGSFKGVNVAFGTEYRYENFGVNPGSQASYGNYDVNGNLVNPTTEDALLSRDFFGSSRPSGAQCFAGFLQSNEVDADRSSVAAYTDFEFDFSDAFLLAVAGRYENYSDFGSTFNYKVAARYRVSNNFNLRAGHSTGFRAPSLHQIHFSRTSTIFTLINGVSVPQEVGVFANTSRAAALLGIPDLKEETSSSISLGLTAKVPSANLKITIDGYLVNIDDRVVLTGQFGPGSDPELQSIFDQAGATRAAFFANAINTKSKGIDIVLSHSKAFSEDAILRNDFAATFSNTEWDQEAGINASDLLRSKGLVGTYFDQESRLYLEQAVPRVKFTLSNVLELNNLNVYLRNTYFGQTTEATTAAIFDADLNQVDTSIDPYNAGKVITDLSFGYHFSKDLSLTVGANNVLDVYPDVSDPAFQSSGRFVYSRRSPQFSYGGRHLFARLLFTLK